MENKSLLEQIQALGISREQSIEALSIVSDMAKKKYPILEGTINSFLRKEFGQIENELAEKTIDCNK